MPSEKLASGENLLKGELAAAWNILEGSSGDYTDLGIARRFGGSAAAYSLRDIGAMNGSVVRVRREPEDTTDAIDDEEKFSANQVQDGTLERWVNGELESTLPADVAIAAAAYSLRKVRADYSGDAVRIRRSSDDIEVDVAFDSDGKVSASSTITNVAEQGGESGQTTATTLGDFLGQTSITTGVAEMAQGDSSALSNATTTGFTLTQTGSLIGAMFPFSSNIGAGTKVTMTFTLSEDSGDASSSFRLFGTTGLANAGSPSTIEKASSGTYTIEFEATAQARGIGFFDNVSGSVVTISNASITIENSAFVHTWYDQAGSNDAVQDTATYQPKIAENGALLADGLDFDGSNDFLQTSTQVLTGTETGANSMYVVVKQTSGDAGYICGSAEDKVGSDFFGQSLYGNNVDGVFALSNGNNIDEPERDNITITQNSTVLVSANYSNNNTNTLNKNANNDGYANGTSAYDFNAGTKFTIGARDGSTAEAVLFNGSIKEIIAYDSDQSANRFKIESNINNYYGLYNDANEVTGAFTSSGAESFTANGTDGFTLTNSTSTAFAGLELNQVLAAGEKIYISFNLSIDAGSNTSPNLNIRESSITGGTASDEGFFEPTEGFNSTVFTSDSGGDARYISFGENDADPSTYSISDFKVSRIARNGFVETWYDQSANLRDAIQGTSTNQPSIVQNGGIVKVNSKPAITFDGNDNFLEVDGTGSAVAYSFSPSGDMGMFIVSKQFTGNVVDSRDGAGDGIFLQQASSDTTRFRYNGDGSIDITATRDAQHFSTMTLDSTTLSASVDGGTAGTDTVTAGVSTTSNLVLGKAFSGNNSNFVDGEIQEAIFYENNKTSEKSDIETDIDNFYSIT